MDFYKNILRARRLYHKLKTCTWYKLFLKKCGKNNVVIKPISFTPKGISLGNNISINNGCRLEGVFSHAGISYNPVIELNNNINIEQNLHLTCANKITIGNDTAISANVTITDIIHPFENNGIIYKNQPLIVKEVVIGDNCLILNNSVILPGVFIGNGCVVGANSVVREGTYPDFSVLAGSPARIVKRYDTTKKQWVR
ncbi:DapH/DapD/GlmU-related protein [Mucilaginibacter sp. Mucisp84]|uniref:acyltransferase n=1 Tax=Mucilaginibacter sp. Mucisp84 TaxID=3243058 RepID=UPI0039A5AAB3